MEVSVPVSYSSQLRPALLLADIVYPLLFGALGSTAASALEGARPTWVTGLAPDAYRSA